MSDFSFFEPGVLRVPGKTGPSTSSHPLMLALKCSGRCLHSRIIHCGTGEYLWGSTLQKKNHLSWNIEYPILLQTTVYFKKEISSKMINTSYYSGKKACPFRLTAVSH